MKKNKNIMQLVEHLLPGGTERMAVNISNLLVKNGYNVVLCATRANGALEQYVLPAVQLECLHKSRFLDIRAFLKLCTLVRKNKIDIIHAHSSSIYWAALLKLFFPRVVLIWHDHFGSRLTDKNNFIYKWLAPLVNGIISVNAPLKDWAIKNMNIKQKENIIFLNNFPVLSSYSKMYDDKNEINIVLLANLREEKDHLNFLQAFASIKNEIVSNVKIIFAGLYWNNDYYHRLKQFINDENISAYVSFLGSVDNVSELLANSDIGIITSVFEGLPVSLLEYGQAGLAVIVTDVGQCAEVVDYGKAGLVVPPSDPKAFSVALLDLIQHPEKRTYLGSALQKRIEKEYGAQKFFEEYSKLIG